MKIVRVVFVLALIFVIFVPFHVTGSGEYEHKVVHYVALGDSIAGGYGLADAQEESYVGRIANALEQKYGAVRVTNFGENGMQSKDLLDILTNPENEKYETYRTAIGRADIITLSIGSNDLLHFISRDMDLEEFQKNGDQIFTEACEKFSENIPKILDAITTNAPQAQLFVDNIYNPCHDISFGISEELIQNLDVMAEKYIEQINSGFETEQIQSVFHDQGAGKKGYSLIDVKGAFDNSEEKLINMMVSWRSIDPHPNKEGHRVIAELIIPRISLDK